MKLKFANALSLALIMAMLLTSVGLADNIQDDVAVTYPNGVSLVAGDLQSSATVGYYVHASNGNDGDTGCNLDGGAESLTISINTPSGVSASPSSLTFTACETDKFVTFAAAANAQSGNVTVSITNNTSGGGSYNLSPASFPITVIAAPVVQNQTITFGVLGAKTYGDADFSLSASASSGLAVSFTAAGNCSVSGSTVHITGAGSCTVTAHQAGNASYNAAPDVSRSFNIAKANATINVSGYSGVYDGAAHSATGTATGVGGADLSGSLSLGASFTDVPGGTASWSFSGGTNYNDASGNVAITIGQASSTVTVDCTVGAPFTYTGSDQTPCTAKASGVGMSDVDVSASLSYSNNINAGPATANASWGGDANHTGNTGSGGFTIGQASSTVTVDCTVGAPFTYTGSDQTPCTAKASGVGMSDVDVSASLSYSNNINAGPATANASWGGDANHTGTTGSGGFTIGRAPTTTTVTCGTGPFVYTGSSITPCSASVTGAGGLSQSLTVNYSNNTAVGTATASATYAGDVNHTGSSDSKNFQILPWTLNGFFQPVDMSPLAPTTIVWNTVKNGSTVPLKFEVFAGSTELTDTSVIAATFTKQIACASGTDDNVEVLATGATSLRYDPTGIGQFIFNWQTPKKPGQCYQVTMTTLDGSSLSAYFKLK